MALWLLEHSKNDPDRDAHSRPPFGSKFFRCNLLGYMQAALNVPRAGRRKWRDLQVGDATKQAGGAYEMARILPFGQWRGPARRGGGGTPRGGWEVGRGGCGAPPVGAWVPSAAS